MASTNLDSLLIWEANAEPGDAPVCISNSGNDETGLSVSLYRDEEGEIRGVLVYQGPTLLTMTGWLPAEVLLKELEYATS